ncbi:hypothetical protein Tco_1409676 [Tanacetum coccineum]
MRSDGGGVVAARVANGGCGGVVVAASGDGGDDGVVGVGGWMAEIWPEAAENDGRRGDVCVEARLTNEKTLDD